MHSLFIVSIQGVQKVSDRGIIFGLHLLGRHWITIILTSLGPGERHEDKNDPKLRHKSSRIYN